MLSFLLLGGFKKEKFEFEGRVSWLRLFGRLLDCFYKLWFVVWGGGDVMLGVGGGRRFSKGRFFGKMRCVFSFDFGFILVRCIS